MAEALGTASEIANLVHFIPELRCNIVTWRLRAERTPKSVDNLHYEISRAIDVFSNAHKVFAFDLSTSHVAEGLRRKFNAAFEKLYSLRCKCKHFVHLSIIKEDSRDLDEELDDTADLLAALLHPLENPRATSRQPGYRVAFSAPVNPTNVYLDFQSKDPNGNPATFESALMEKLLSPSSGRTVGAVSARGMGGVGKTVAMRGVVLHPDVQKRFRGGIFFASIGAVGGLSDLKIALAGMVRTAGGRQVADDIQADDDFSQAVQIAAEWFSHSPCLFIFDDVWLGNGITAGYLQVLFGVAHHRESRLALTSRESGITNLCSEAVVFQPRGQNGAESVNILLRSAGVQRVPSSTEGKGVFNGILKECNGLSLALSLAGAAVRNLGSRVSDTEGRWVAYRQKRSTIIKNVQVDGERMLLKESVIFSLALASACISETIQTNANDVFSWFRSFAVFMKHRPVPALVLRRLWNVKQPVVETVLSTLQRFSIVQARCNEDGTTESVTIHDMVLDVAKELCVEGEVSLLSRNLLMSYVPQEGRSGDCGEDELDVESLVGIEDDGFVLLNMCTLLHQCGMLEVLCRLIADPRWLVNQLHKNGHDQVQKDIQLCLDLPDGNMFEGQREKVSFVSFLQATSLAVARMAKDLVSSQWEGMAWFQLYGRLKVHAETNMFTHKLVQDVKCKAPRPWVEPSSGCLPSSSGSMARIIRLQNCDYVFCFQRFGNSLYICHKIMDSLVIRFFDWGSTRTKDTYTVEMEAIGGGVECACFYDRDIVVLGLDNGYVIILSRQTPRTSWDNVRNQVGESTNLTKEEEMPKDANDRIEHSQARERNRPGQVILDEDTKIIYSKDREIWHLVKLQGHTKAVNSVAVSSSNDGQMMEYTSNDTTLIPSVQGQEDWTTNTFSRYTNFNRTIAVSDGGMRVVSGSTDRTVRVWEKGEEGWCSETLLGHEGEVRTVAVTSDGRQVVSGSFDKTVRVWEKGEEGWCSQTLLGHEDGVTSVAITDDGRRVLSGSYDATLGVWEKGEEGWCSQMLSGHEGGVWTVAVTGDGRRVVSGSYDTTVRVWEKDEEGWWSHTISGHEGEVWRVSLTDDGKWVLSGSYDETVRMWEKEEEGWWSHSIPGHEDNVFKVAVTDGGRLVVSGSYDETVRVWEKGEEGWWSTTLSGHEEDIHCVAMSDDGSRVVYGAYDMTVRVWEKGEEGWWSEILSGHEDAIRTVAVTDDGRQIVSGSSDGMVRVWEKGEEGWRSETLSGHEDEVMSVDVMGDGRRVVSASSDGTIRVWEKGEEGWWSQSILELESGVRNVAVSRDGKRVACGLYSDAVWVCEEVGGEDWRPYCIQIGEVISEVTFLGTDTIEYTLESEQGGYLERDLTSWKRKHGGEIREPICLARGKCGEGKSNRLPASVWEEVFEKIGAFHWKETTSGYFCRLRDKPLVGQLDVIT